MGLFSGSLARFPAMVGSPSGFDFAAEPIARNVGRKHGKPLRFMAHDARNFKPKLALAKLRGRKIARFD